MTQIQTEVVLLTEVEQAKETVLDLDDDTPLEMPKVVCTDEVCEVCT